MSPRRVGLALLAALAALALLGPLVLQTDPNAQDLRGFWAPPSVAHPLGTDHLGRCVLARVVHGAGHSLGLALLSVALAAAIGTGLGLLPLLIGLNLTLWPPFIRMTRAVAAVALTAPHVAAARLAGLPELLVDGATCGHRWHGRSASAQPSGSATPS